MACMVAIKHEFPLFKQLVFHSYSSMSIHELSKVIAAKLQVILMLFSACLVVPISTTQCEHRFSTQNHIKRKTRNCLKTKHLDILLCISEEDPQLKILFQLCCIKIYENERHEWLAGMAIPYDQQLNHLLYFTQLLKITVLGHIL